jgi:hypothetical protein
MVVHRDDLARMENGDPIARAAADRGIGERLGRNLGFTRAGFAHIASGRGAIGGTAQRAASGRRIGGRTRELGFETHGITDKGDVDGMGSSGAECACDFRNGSAIAAHCIDYDSHSR